jgi:hypothetical protein
MFGGKTLTGLLQLLSHKCKKSQASGLFLSLFSFAPRFFFSLVARKKYDEKTDEID